MIIFPLEEGENYRNHVDTTSADHKISVMETENEQENTKVLQEESAVTSNKRFFPKSAKSCDKRAWVSLIREIRKTRHFSRKMKFEIIFYHFLLWIPIIAVLIPKKIFRSHYKYKKKLRFI